MLQNQYTKLLSLMLIFWLIYQKFLSNHWIIFGGYIKLITQMLPNTHTQRYIIKSQQILSTINISILIQFAVYSIFHLCPKSTKISPFLQQIQVFQLSLFTRRSTLPVLPPASPPPASNQFHFLAFPNHIFLAKVFRNFLQNFRNFQCHKNIPLYTHTKKNTPYIYNAKNLQRKFSDKNFKIFIGLLPFFLFFFYIKLAQGAVYQQADTIQTATIYKIFLL